MLGNILLVVLTQDVSVSLTGNVYWHSKLLWGLLGNTPIPSQSLPPCDNNCDHRAVYACWNGWHASGRPTGSVNGNGAGPLQHCCEESSESHLRESMDGRCGPVACPPRSPDLACLDFFLWGHMKQLVYEIVVETEEDLVSRITVAADSTADMPGIYERTRQTSQAMYCVHTGQQSRIRVVPVNTTAVISMLNYFLCKSSLASEIAVKDHMYHNEIYLFWYCLPPVLIWTNSFGTPSIGLRRYGQWRYSPSEWSAQRIRSPPSDNTST